MKGLLLSSLLVAVAVLSAESVSFEGSTNSPPAKTQNIPGKLGVNSGAKAQPLLLLDDEEDKATGGADNSRCLVCHINFERELLSVVHAKTNIGCAKCHGESDAHIADESWASGGNGTAPDRMFPTNKINAFCLTCHPKSKLKACAFIKPSANQKNICTDCHGKHRMAKRKCKWK
jgi:hypothetical protein